MFRAVSHIILIPLLLVATIGMTVDLHFCQQQLYDVGILSQAESCCAPGSSKAHTSNQSCHLAAPQSNHCEDETLELDTTDDFVVVDFQQLKEVFPALNLFATHTEAYNSLHSTFSYKPVLVVENHSPPGTSSLLSLLQTYRL